MNKKQREQRRMNTREAEVTAKRKRDERAADWLWEYIFKPNKPSPDSRVFIHGATK